MNHFALQEALDKFPNAHILDKGYAHLLKIEIEFWNLQLTWSKVHGKQLLLALSEWRNHIGQMEELFPNLRTEHPYVYEHKYVPLLNQLTHLSLDGGTSVRSCAADWFAPSL